MSLNKKKVTPVKSLSLIMIISLFIIQLITYLIHLASESKEVYTEH